jgi:DnaJ-class molecular chaperone
MSFHKIIGQLFRNGKLLETRFFIEELESEAQEKMEKLIRSPSDMAIIFYGEIVKPLTEICKTCLGRGRRKKTEVILKSLCPGCNGIGREKDKPKTKEEL